MVFVKNKINNHVDLVKMNFLIMVYKKISFKYIFILCFHFSCKGKREEKDGSRRVTFICFIIENFEGKERGDKINFMYKIIDFIIFE